MNGKGILGKAVWQASPTFWGGLTNGFVGKWSFALLLVLVFGRCATPTESALEKGAGFLASIQRADGAICDTVNPLFDIWETVEAATALFAYRKDTTDPSLQKAMAFLRAHENSAGLLCHNVKCRNAYCLETTSEYFILLANMYGAERIRSRMDTIRKLQKPTGEWEIGNPDVLEAKDFPSVTGFVMAAFQAAGVEPQYPAEAWNWLIGKQTNDGHWGQDWEYYGNESYALWAVLRALQQAGNLGAQLAVNRAANYMYKQQMGNLKWDSGNPRQQKKISAELETALMLAGYPDMKGVVGHLATENAVKYLLERQRPDGHWEGGNFPIANARYVKEEYVFATARAMVALEMKLHEGNGPGVME